MRAFLLFLLAAVASGFAPAAWRPTARVALHAITDPGSEAMIEGDKLRKNMKERIDKAESKLLSEIKMPDLPAAAPVEWRGGSDGPSAAVPCVSYGVLCRQLTNTCFQNA